MKRLLKYINSIPFPFTIKHFQTFGASTLKDNSLNHIESWDTLRANHPHFSVASERDEWLQASELKVKKDGQDSGLIKRAEDIVSLLRRERIMRVFSVGVGGAGLEYQIKKHMPELSLVCSEYSIQNVNRLKKVFTEADDIIQFDIMKGSWEEVKHKFLQTDRSALLIYRLDAGFKNEEWRSIFESIHKAGIDRVIYIPTTLLTMLSIWNRKKRETFWHLTQIPISFAGYLRTKKMFQRFWRLLYKEECITLGGLKAFFLKKAS